MSKINVGIGEYQVSNNSDDEIRTFALGSCVAVITYDQHMKRAGLIHIALPEAAVNESKARELPGYFVDTGLPVFLDAIGDCRPGSAGTRIRLVGGSNIMDTNRRFDIGKRNVLAIKKYLWKRRLGIIAEDVGGNISRTVSVSVSTGRVTVASNGEKWEL